MPKKVLLIALILVQVSLFAQQKADPEGQNAPKKYALVIGNSNYVGLSPLANPVNDASDIAAILEHIGFTVDRVLNGSRVQMKEAVSRLKDRLSAAENAYGFFFYAGHGVQSGGENFLIPVDANIPSENYLRDRAVSVQTLLDDLNDARNGLNVVVLDACRDNPFGWSRSGTRGLTIVTRQPADSIIVYSTSAGSRASDGEGRNGLFTSQLINNLATPGLEVKDVFNRTGADVAKVSNNQQIPAIYSQFFKTAYLGELPVDSAGNQIQTTKPVIIYSGGQSQEINAAKLWSIGASAGTNFSEPWIVGTIRGTVAPFKYQFLEVGLDAGFASARQGVKFNYSLAPYIHYAFFWPFNNKAALHTGAGLSYIVSQYQSEYQSSDRPAISAFGINIAVGILLFDFLDISDTLSFAFGAQSSSNTQVGNQ